MGGLEALTVGLTHTDQFAWVGGFSAAVHLVTPQTFAAVDPKKANLKLLFISCGSEDNLLEADDKLAATLQAQGFKVAVTDRPGFGHVWQEWRPDLAAFASRLFK
jgi:enterochelin esterase family protein